MKMQRNKTKLLKMTKDDDPFVDASPQELMDMMWELTAEAWSLTGTFDAEQRLQRNVTKLIDLNEYKKK